MAYTTGESLHFWDCYRFLDEDERCLKKQCIAWKADDEDFDKAIHIWFMQEWHKGIPINGVGRKPGYLIN